MGRARMVAAVIIVVLIGAALFYFSAGVGAGHPTGSSSSSSSASQSAIQGIVAGIVTVGPSQPVCSPNQPCTEDLTGYSLVFTSQCGTGAAPQSASCQRQNYTAPIAPSGHYSILLVPGNYTISGLSPSCNWVGCSASFPKAVTVEGGQQLIVNVNVDTGIR